MRNTLPLILALAGCPKPQDPSTVTSMQVTDGSGRLVHEQIDQYTPDSSQLTPEQIQSAIELTQNHTRNALLHCGISHVQPGSLISLNIADMDCVSAYLEEEGCSIDTRDISPVPSFISRVNCGN